MRTTRWTMVAIGLAAWLFAVAWPGYQWPIFTLGITLVMAAVYGLLTE